MVFAGSILLPVYSYGISILTGGIQPDALIAMLNKSDYDGFMDRHIILAPRDIIPNFEDRTGVFDPTVFNSMLDAIYAVSNRT